MREDSLVVMKLKELIPALKPGLILATINVILCAIFAAGATLAIAISATLLDVWNLPVPLMPVVVLCAIPVSVIAWLIVGARVAHPRPLRYAIAAIGTSPLIGVVALAVIGALWFVTLPSPPQATLIGPIMIALVASVAIAVCAGCVIWGPFLGSAAAPEQEA